MNMYQLAERNKEINNIISETFPKNSVLFKCFYSIVDSICKRLYNQLFRKYSGFIHSNFTFCTLEFTARSAVNRR